MVRQTHARVQVVLALGAFGTPELLISSGIGDPGDLRRLGVPVRSALPGVGQNLQDHPVVMGMNFLSRGRLGLARDNGGGAVMNWRSSQAARPDLHAFVAQNKHAYPDGAARYGLDGGQEVFAISPGLMGSVSAGYLRVHSLDEAAGRGGVEIVSGFLTEQADVDALADGVEMIMDLAATAAYADLIDKPLMPAVRLDRAGREAFVRENCATFFHACGTAAMGTGPAAVVDPELNVIGIEGLRIADASVIPVIPTCNTQAPVIAIAERAADLILGSASAP
jgi:choline dehydrogenase